MHLHFLSLYKNRYPRCEGCHLGLVTSVIVVWMVHVPSANIKEAGRRITYTAASHQGAISKSGLPFWGAAMSSILKNYLFGKWRPVVTSTFGS